MEINRIQVNSLRVWESIAMDFLLYCLAFFQAFSASPMKISCASNSMAYHAWYLVSGFRQVALDPASTFYIGVHMLMRH